MTGKTVQPTGVKNIFEEIPGAVAEEFFEELAGSGPVRVERIVSNGHESPETGWYNQAHAEFVLVLEGAARLEFENGGINELKKGDRLEIAPHCRHRVAWTQPGIDTIWLAVHYPSIEEGETK